MPLIHGTLPTMTPFQRHPATLASVTLAVLTLTGVALWSSQSNAQDDKKPASKPALTVSTVQPQATRLPIKLAANGNITAWQEASVGAEANGLRLTEVRVNVGDRVRAGDVLATFAADTLRAEAAQAKASLMEAEANAAEAAGNAERARSLQASGALSASQINQYLTAEQTAKARVEAARALAPGATGAAEPDQRAGARRRRDLRTRGHRGRGGGRGHRAVPHDPQGPAGVARRSHVRRAGPHQAPAPPPWSRPPAVPGWKAGAHGRRRPWTRRPATRWCMWT
jgi:multidrug efflux pump subunit AcrA (membrane-fusion protein)